MLALIQARPVKVVKKWLKRLKPLLRAIDKSSSFDKQLTINNISRIMLNGWLRRKDVDYNLTGLVMQGLPLKTEVFTRHLNIYLNFSLFRSIPIEPT